MIKKILSILLLLTVAISVVACGKKNPLDNIVKKFNNCETVKQYKEYDYVLKASSTKNKLTISSVFGEDKSKVDFKLDGNILSSKNLNTDDLLLAFILIDSIGQTYGYKDGDLLKNFNAFSYEMLGYTLDKEGIEFEFNDDSISLKIDISKKIPLIDINKFYLTTDEFDILKEIIADNELGNQTGASGNIGYDVVIGEEKSTIEIGQDDELGDSAYKSIVSALEVIYGEEVAKHFQEVYPKFVDGKTIIEAFTIETNYEVEYQEDTVFKDKKVVLVTVDNNGLE